MTSRLGGQTAVPNAIALVRRALLAALLLVNAGCGPLGLGRLGNYRFAVEMPTEQPSVRSDFAFLVGMDATLIVEPTRAGDGGFAKIASSDPSVVAILSRDGRRVAIHAEKPGDATLWVTGASGAVDYMAIRVRPAAKVSLESPALAAAVPSAEGERVAAVPLGEQIRFDVRVEDAAGERLVAPAGMAVRITPSERASVVAPFFADSIDLRFDAPGRATLEGDAGPPLHVDVIRPEDAWSLGVADVTSMLLGGDAGTLRMAILAPTVTVNGVREPLVSGQVELRVKTKEVCEEGADALGLRVPAPGRPRLYVVVPKTGRPPGPAPSCEVELSVLGRTASYAATFASP